MEGPSREIGVLFEAARTADAAEDATCGESPHRHDLPVDLRRRWTSARRLATIRAAKDALEQEAREAAALLMSPASAR